MCSSEEILSSLNDLHSLANLLKINCDLILSDLIYSHLANHFLCQAISIEGLAVQRNLYGRSRSSVLNQCEIQLLIYNIKECFHSNSELLIKVFLQYLHNINRLLSKEFSDISYLCALILLPNGNKNVLACILCAYLDMNMSNKIRFDMIINGLYENEDEDDDDNPWMDQLKIRLIEKDNQWLRKFYLEKIYTKELLHAIDTHEKENILHIQPINQEIEQLSSPIIEKLDLTEVLSLDDLHFKFSSYITHSLPIKTIKELSLFHLFSSSKTYPYDLHLLFTCLLISLLNPSNYNETTLRLFRRLIDLINNYYIHQEDLLDDNRYRLILVYLLSKFLNEIHRRRSNNEHQWYYFYREVPINDPLPTFDLFSDLLCLLSTLTYNHMDCQNEVRETSGTIESILSMTQIDLNQPKSQASVAWLLKCLTEYNEENRNYIKQIK